MIVIAARRLHALEPPGFAPGFGVEVTLGAVLSWTVVSALAHWDAGRMAEGPLGDLIVGGRCDALWRCIEAATLLCPVWMLAAASTALLSPPAGFRLAGASALGGGLVAALVVSRGEAGGGTSIGGAIRVAGRSPRRGSRALPAAAILVLALLAAAAARRNNVDPGLATFVLGVGGLAAGVTLAKIDVSLLRFLGHEPTPLAGLLLRFAVAPAGTTAGGVVLAGAAAGLGGPTACALAAASALVTGAYAALVVLHALGGVGRFASAAAGVDLALAAAIATAAAVPMALVWVVARAAMLTASARRRRWLEP